MFKSAKTVVTSRYVTLKLHGNCFNISRNLSTKPEFKANETEWDNALPYKKIPSVGIRHFLPGGQFYNVEFKKFHLTLNQNYGKIVKLSGIPGRKDIVCTYDPNDFEKVLRTEGTWPVRNGNEIVKYYRTVVRPEIFGNNGGLVAEHGEKWQTVRTKVNPVMLQPKIVKQYVPGIDQIAKELSQKIRRDRDSNNQVWDNFNTDVHKWAIESISFIALDTRLNAILDDDPNSEGHKLVTAAREIFVNLFKLELSASLWRYYKTPLFNKFMKDLDGITEIILNCIQRSLDQMEVKKNDPRTTEESILQKLIKIDRPTAVIMAADMLLAGADTTGAMALTILCALSRNPDKQQKLREEILTFLPTKESLLEPGHLVNIPYLRACLKEAIRLNPVILSNFRQTGQNLVLQGYQIPKGVDISMGNLVPQRDAEQFPEPDKFIPERWLKSSAAKTTSHPFAFLPFGFGARSCIGRRFAELEVECLIARLLRDYYIVWNSKEDVKYHSDFINAPVGKLHLVFNDVEY